jgi:hypothetical protein
MILAALARRKLEQRWEITAAGRRALEAAELEAVLEESALQELRVIGEEEERRAALEELRELERLRELEDCWGGPRDDYGLRELEGGGVERVPRSPRGESWLTASIPRTQK